MADSEKLPLLQTELVDEDERYYARRYYQRRKIISKIIGIAMVAEVLYMGAYKTPILIEEQHLAGTEPVLEHIVDTPKHLAAETIVMGGFGVRDSTPIAEALPQLGEIGAVEAVEQDNQGVDPYVIAQKIIKQAKEQGLTEIGLWGDSVSGLTFSKVAKIIQEDTSLLRVRFIVLDCTPPSIDALRKDKRDSVELLHTISSIPFFNEFTAHPAVEYAYAQERLSSQPHLVAGSHFGIDGVLQEMNAVDTPSSTLVTAEALQVVNPSITDDLKAVAQVKNKQPPVIITIEPRSPVGDQVVISSIANREISEITREAGLKHIRIRLSGISHGDPTANRKQYQAALTNIILPAIESYDRSISSRLYAIDRPG